MPAPSKKQARSRPTGKKASASKKKKAASKKKSAAKKAARKRSSTAPVAARIPSHQKVAPLRPVNEATAAFAGEIHDRLLKLFGKPRMPLDYTQPHEMAIAVILSAQCTDERVNEVTPALFATFPTPKDYYSAPIEQIEELIYSTGFYKNKAKSIREFCRLLDERHGGTIPDNIPELIKLPGIGRKTANVVLNHLYDKATGIVVDTHVLRLARLLGLTKYADAVKVERELMERIPERYWLDWSLLLVFLGRKNCTARKPVCVGCVLFDLCPSRDPDAA